MKKILLAVLLSLTIAVLAVSPAFAAEITGVESDGNKITAHLTADSAAEKDKVTATLDGKPLAVESVDTAQGSTEYIVMIDTSLSLSNEHFEAQKEAVTSLYKSLGENDKFILYTFDKSSDKILDGSESSEDALKKIASIKASGMETAFYDAMVTLSQEAGKSTADSTVPIVFTDGVETLDKGAKSKAEKALKESKVPVYGMYPSVEKAADSAALNDLLKLSGGSATAFTPGNIKDKLKDYAGKKAASGITAVFTSDEPIAANDKAVLSIDLGDGKPVTKETPVKAWEPESAQTETETQSETETQIPETETETAVPGTDDQDLDLMKIIIPAVAALVLIAAVLLIFKKLKGGKKQKPESEPEAPEAPAAEIQETPEQAAEEEIAEPAEQAVPEEEPVTEPEVQEAPEQAEEAEAAQEEESAEGEAPADEGENAEEQDDEEPAETEEDAEKKAAAKRRAEERAKRRAANLERAKAAAAARAAMVSSMSNETKEAAEAAAAKEAEKNRKREKEEAQAAKERAKKEKANKKKMKEEGGNFQFYFVDKK